MEDLALSPVVQAIVGRRSIREGFEPTPVDAEVVDEIVRCGLAAPSSKNAQPWRVHVVTDRARLARLAEAVREVEYADKYVPIDPSTGRQRPDWHSTVAESADVLAQVPLALFIENRAPFSNGRRCVATARDEVRENALVGYGFEMIGLGAAIQSMWLAACAAGLEGSFMGDVLIAEDAIRADLGMTGDLAGVLVFGVTDGGHPPRRIRELRDVLIRHDAAPLP